MTEKLDPDKHQFYTVAEICKLTRSSRPTVYKWINSEAPNERLKATNAGGKFLIRPDDFEDWLVRNQLATG